MSKFYNICLFPCLFLCLFSNLLFSMDNNRFIKAKSVLSSKTSKDFVTNLSIPKLSSWISKVVWSSDENLIAAISGKIFFICDVNSKKVIYKKVFKKTISTVDWSCGNYIAVGFLNGSIKVYDFNNSLNKIAELETEKNQKVQQLSWSPNGKYLMSYSKSSNFFITDISSNHLNNSGIELSKTDTFDNQSVIIIWDLEKIKSTNTNTSNINESKDKIYKKIFLNNHISFIEWSNCGNLLAVAENIYNNGFLNMVFNFISNKFKKTEFNNADKSYVKVLKPFESDPINPIFTNNFEQEAQIMALKWGQKSDSFALILTNGTIKIYSLTPQTINYNDSIIKPTDITFLVDSTDEYLVVSLRDKLEFINTKNGSKIVKKINLKKINKEFSLHQIVAAKKSSKIASIVKTFHNSSSPEKLKIFNFNLKK